MILCIGEILADMTGLRRGNAFYYERNAGGAPFNVACAIKKFGGSSAFVGCVGDDSVGRFLCDFAAGQGLDGLYIATDKSRNTTLAFVDLDSSGERYFSFYRKNTADYHLPEVPAELMQRADIICIGSLMLSEEEGVAYAKNVIAQAKRLGKFVAFDVNYRADIFRSRSQALQRYKQVIAEADILKFSQEEEQLFTREFISSLTQKLVLISLGKQGSRWQYGGACGTVPSIAVSPADTTGAGDAFFAGVLTCLNSVPSGGRTVDFLNKALRFGNVCGALNTLGKGAIANLPDIGQIKKYL